MALQIFTRSARAEEVEERLNDSLTSSPESFRALK
jgi:hypothetical protein